MKTLATLIRHFVTGLAVLGTYLAAKGFVDPTQADQMNHAGSDLIEPLTAFLCLIALIVTRLAMTWLGKRFPSLAGLGTQMSGGASAIALMCMAAALMGFCLPSCTTAAGVNSRGWPVTIGIHTPNGDVGYSSKSGLSVSAVIRDSGK